MDAIVYDLGGYPITVLMVLIACGAVVAVAVAAAVILAMRAARRAENTGTADERAEKLEQVLSELERSQNALEDSRRVADEQKDRRISQLSTELELHRRQITDLNSENARLRERLEQQTVQAEEKLSLIQNARADMTVAFKNLAEEVLKSHGETFSKQNREQIGGLLDPLRQKLIEFQQGLQAVHTESAKERATLGEQIRTLHENSLKMSAEASNLTRALKSNSQTQGAWGEMILSTILERSGLREGEEFVTQESHTTEDGGRLRTDVEVRLPTGQLIVIDSKVSLNAFMGYVNAEDDEERQGHLRSHLASLRNHIKTLGSKEYQRHTASGPDYVLMFVPIEAAFSVAIEADQSILDFAVSQNVAVTTPTTLMTTLRTVRNIWDIEKRHRNAEEIAERAGSLYDKIVGFLNNMDRLGRSLSQAQQSFDDARAQLSSGRGNVLRQIEMLKELGAKTTKAVPGDWVDGGTGLPTRRAADVREQPETGEGTSEDMRDAEPADAEARNNGGPLSPAEPPPAEAPAAGSPAPGMGFAN